MKRRKRTNTGRDFASSSLKLILSLLPQILFLEEALRTLLKARGAT